MGKDVDEDEEEDDGQSPDIDKLIALVKGSNSRKLRSFLEEDQKGIQLTEVTDKRGYTLLHIAAFKKYSGFESILCDSISK